MKNIEGTTIYMKDFTEVEAYTIKKALKELRRFNIEPKLIVEYGEELLDDERLLWLYQFRKCALETLLEFKSLALYGGVNFSWKEWVILKKVIAEKDKPEIKSGYSVNFGY